MEGGDGDNNTIMTSGCLGMLFAAIVVVLAGSGFYTIKESDCGVVLAFWYSALLGSTGN